MQKQFILLKSILLVVLAAALFSAVAGAVHIETAPTTNCIEETEVAAPEHHHDGHDHEDHIHQCGQCHFHIIQTSPVFVVFMPLDQKRERILLDDQALSSSLSGLFRPPRR